MATLEKLEEQKRALEERLADGDLSAEAALERIDRAIAARTRNIEHSRTRLAAVKQAVKSGVAKEDTTPKKVAARSKARMKSRGKTNGPLNRFS